MLWGASDALLHSVGASLAPTISWIRDRHIEPVKASLVIPHSNRAYAERRAMTPEQAIAFARQQALLLR